jgi:tetratricopeptide (TPR) repeat protein
MSIPFLPMNPKMVERTPHPGPLHEPEEGGGKEEDRPHPSLLPQEKESLFPRLVNLRALSLCWFRCSKREIFRGILLRPIAVWLGALVGAGAFVLLAGCTDSGSDHTKLASRYAGSASCRECHADAYELWMKSNHGLAERSFRTNVDAVAFQNPRYSPPTLPFGVGLTNDHYSITAIGLSGQPEVHAVGRVLGNDPLRQFLTGAPGGRWQAMTAAYDPHRQEWFDVFGQENRQPGEWGNWTGRGMNWNSMCAACHNTQLRKNYDEAADGYHTTMMESSVGCEACHGPLQNHVDWEKKNRGQNKNDPNFPQFTPRQTMETCASCHARRADLTGEFMPGDRFDDHYDLAIVDHSEVFYPDGQNHEEDYEYTAFLGSKMAAAGVTCLDCHPRSLHMPRPQGNGVCLRCHATGQLHAPIIQPAAHSHHQASGAGNDCVNCHLPVTVYMQRHARHDHGLTIPDPLLTQEFGIPNACNRCHPDKTTDWALAAEDQWYGINMNRPTRLRAEWLARARQGDAAARDPLVAMLTGEPNPYWQAVAAGLLDQWLGEPSVQHALTQCLANSNALVRATAVRTLEPLVQSTGSPAVEEMRRLLTDPLRNVRINAAWALRGDLDTNSPAGRELLHYLDFNADQPNGQMQKGAFYFARSDLSTALPHFERAVNWDTNSAPLHHEYAVALSAAGRNPEAIAQLEAACRLDPRAAEYFYALGLAWNEAGNLPKTIESLEAAVKLDARNARAWYNLGLAHNAAGDTAAALNALTRGESADPQDPAIPYARATILAKVGRVADARTAAHRALNLQPNFIDATRLLEMLSQ